jgi:MFS family permease
MTLYTVCTIICGVSTNIGLFFAFRLLQGIFGSAGQAVGGGSVNDIFEPHQRGKAMGIYMLR